MVKTTIIFFSIFTLAGITKNSRSKNICEKKKKAMNNSKTIADLSIFIHIIVTFFHSYNLVVTGI